MAIFISEKVVADVQFWTALIGFSGVVIGAIITIIGNILLHQFQQRQKNSNDKLRKKLLK